MLLEHRSPSNPGSDWLSHPEWAVDFSATSFWDQFLGGDRRLFGYFRVSAALLINASCWLVTTHGRPRSSLKAERRHSLAATPLMIQFWEVEQFLPWPPLPMLLERGPTVPRKTEERIGNLAVAIIVHKLLRVGEPWPCLTWC